VASPYYDEELIDLPDGTTIGVDELIGAQRPRLWTVPPRHRVKQDGCRACANPNYPTLGCGDYVSRDMLDWSRGIGYELDDWQEWCITEANGVKPNGKWAAMEACVICTRQNGKGTILEVRELAGLFVLKEEMIIHTAHEFKTSRVHFERVRRTIEGNASLSRRVREVRTSHGEEGIKLIRRRTLIMGSDKKYVYRDVAPELKFLARSRSAGRGFTCNCLVYDEAMILTEEQVEASVPTMSSVPNSQMFYMGSSGMKDSYQLAKIHRRIEHDEKSLFGADWSIDPHLATCPRDEQRGRKANHYIVCNRHDDRDDPRNWAKANPAFGKRLSYDFTNNVEFKGMAPVGFDRERLGVGEWPVAESPWLVISEDSWRERTCTEPGGATKPIVFGLDVEPDGNAATITAAWLMKDGRKEVTVIEMPADCYRQGTAWAIPRLKELIKAHRPAAIVIPSTGAAADLKDEAIANGIDVMVAGPTHEAAAFAHFRNSVKEKQLAHLGENSPNGSAIWKAMGSADTRTTGDGGKAWSRTNSNCDISPVTSATLAAWGLHQKRRSYDVMKSIA
jgi:hypothetical protein